RITAKYRVIGNLVFDTELAEPAIGKVNLNLSANPSLGADRKHIADQQHPDHQHRINRRPTSVRVIRRELLVHPTQIEQPVDLPDQMIGWNHLVEIKRIEKLSLPILPPPHHALLPLMLSQPTESRIVSRLNGSFATQSLRKRTPSRPVGMSQKCQKRKLGFRIKTARET